MKDLASIAEIAKEIQFHDKQLHIYITIPNTLKKDGVLSPALVSEKELQHYAGRAGSKKKEAILEYLDSTFPGRSRSISVLTEPIPDTAAPKFLEFRNETQHVIIKSIERLKKLKLIDEVRLSKRPYPVVTQLDYKKIDWSKNPTNLLFKDINHYQLVLTTGKIPSNVIEIDEIKHSQESKGITMSDDSHIDLNNGTERCPFYNKDGEMCRMAWYKTCGTWMSICKATGHDPATPWEVKK